MLISLSGFFSDGKSVRKPLVSAFVKRLLELQEWMQNQTDHRFYSSSLLFLCDGIVEKKNEEPQVDIRMIDFAHVFPIKDGGKDESYISGLTNLIKFMRSLAGESVDEKPKEVKKAASSSEVKTAPEPERKEKVEVDEKEEKEEEEETKEQTKEPDDEDKPVLEDESPKKSKKNKKKGSKDKKKKKKIDDLPQDDGGQHVVQVKEHLLEEASKTAPTASEKGMQTLSVMAHPGVQAVKDKYEGEEEFALELEPPTPESGSESS